MRQGAKRDAILWSLGSNIDHGKRPTPADKRHAVGIMLDDPEWKKWSNAEVARRCGVSQHLVLTVKRERQEAARVAEAAGASSPETRIDPGPQAVTVERGGTVYTLHLPAPSCSAGAAEARDNDLEDAVSALAIAAECLERLGPAYAAALGHTRAAEAALGGSGEAAAA